ncbi:MAG: hypothetical protein RJA44_422 [Pseudomonadota bacterium]
MPAPTTRLALLLLWLLLGLCGWPAQAAAPVRIGVLAFLGKEQAVQQWQATAQALQQALNGRPVELLPLDYDELNQAAKTEQIDFALTNPEHYVVLRNAYGLSAVATLSARIGDQVVDRFGSVIFTRTELEQIQTLDDVRHQRVAAVGLYSLGGFLLAADALRAVNIDLRGHDVASLEFTGLPHTKVVEQVLAGQADVGIVRTGVLESMILSGKIDPAALRVLNIRPTSAYPYRLSTDLAPEWPWIVLPHTDPVLAKIVTRVLLDLPPDSAAARAGRYEGFSPPANYAPVEDLMRRLHVFPRLGPAAALQDLWLDYDSEMRLLLLALTLIGLGVSMHLWRNNQRLREHVSQHQRDQAAIRQLAFYDMLTGLPNRRRFMERLGSESERMQRSRGLGALMFIDLDNFKTLNDTHGHTIGDELLKTIAARLNQTLGSAGLVARLGGDEFVVLLSDLPGDPDEALAQALHMAQRLRDAILAPCLLSTPLLQAGTIQTVSHCCSGSIGVALFGAEAVPLMELMKRADIAMYQAKHAGRNAVRHYDPEVQRQLSARAVLSADLSRAVTDHSLVLYYQVQTDPAGRPVAAECLLRWRHPQQGLIPPDVFIPLAEESGAIVEIGDWVIAQACQTLARWAAQPHTARLGLGVNVSPRQFAESDFMAKLQLALLRSGARPQQLVLEITEGLVLEQSQEMLARLDQLCALGVKLSIDDFGTGYSSLAYLQRLPLHQLKIDRSFVQQLGQSPHAEAIVRAIGALSRSMQLSLVAEGVETEAQRGLLAAIGCDLLQGYLLGRPVPLADFEAELLAPALPLQVGG